MRLPEPDFVMYKALLASLNDPDMDKNVKRALGKFKNFQFKIEVIYLYDFDLVRVIIMVNSYSSIQGVNFGVYLVSFLLNLVYKKH